MKILVTGGAGYIGSHVVHQAVNAGMQSVVVDDLSTGHRELLPAGVELRHFSLLDNARLAALLRESACDAVLHFAAKSLVGEDARDPRLYYETNVGGTLSLLEAMRASGVRKLVFSSSCAVYEASAAPLTEATPRLPLSVYGETKLAMENLVRAYGERHGIEWMAFRYFNAAGAAASGATGEWHEPETHLIPRLAAAIAGGEATIAVYGRDYPTPDGTAIRDYVHVEEIARAHLQALALPRLPALALNLGSGRGWSVEEVVSRVEALAGRQLTRKYEPRRPGDQPILVADNRRARECLDWQPRLGLDEMLRSTLAWEERRRAPRAAVGAR